MPSVRRLCSALSLVLLALSFWSLSQALRMFQPDSIRSLETPAAEFLGSYCPNSHLKVVQESPLRVVVAADCDVQTFASLQPALEHLYDIRAEQGEAITVVPASPPFYWVDHPWLAEGLAGLGLLLALPGFSLWVARRRSPPERQKLRIRPVLRRLFPCPVCDEVFVDEGSLKRHQLTHQNLVKRPRRARLSGLFGVALVCLLTGTLGFVRAQQEGLEGPQSSRQASLSGELKRLADEPILLAGAEYKGRVRLVVSSASRLQPLVRERALARGLEKESVYFVGPPAETTPSMVWLVMLAGFLYWCPRPGPRRVRPAALAAAAPLIAPPAIAPLPEPQLHELLRMDGVVLEIGPDCVEGPRLAERLISVRRQIALELGVPVPAPRIYGDAGLKPGAYVIKVNGVEAGRGQVQAGRYLAIGPEEKLRNLRGSKTVDPTYGMPGTWVPHEQRGDAERLGCMIFDPLSVVATQATEVLRQRAPELLTYEMTHELLGQPHLGPVLEQLRARELDKPKLREILSLLLQERVSIRDLTTICDSLLPAPRGLSVEALLDYARQALGPKLVLEYVNNENVLNCLVVPEDLQLDLQYPGDRSALIARLEAWRQRLQERGVLPVLVCAPECRLELRRLVGGVVLSTREIPASVHINSLGE